MLCVDFVLAMSKPLTYLSWAEAAVLKSVTREDPPVLEMTGAHGQVRVRCHTVIDPFPSSCRRRNHRLPRSMR
jgi:hypothetical protein